jgi:hypothetical protein
MSQLRKNLQSARAEYEQFRYPGDLASEMLPKAQPARPHLARWFWNAGVAVAAAAMVLIFVRVRTPQITSPTPAPDNGQFVEVILDEEPLTEVAWSDLPSLSMPEAPSLDLHQTDEMDMAPPAPTFDFSTPSFSLVEDAEPLQSMNTSSTEETVL